MNVADFRIGNIVLDGQDKPVRIEYLSRKHFEAPLTHQVTSSSASINHGTTQLHELNLDNKWLHKLGFLKEGEGWVREDIKLHPNGKDGFRVEGFNTLQIKYVHQLQNLMFLALGFEDLISIEDFQPDR